MVASEWSRQGEYDEAIQACKEALEQEERTQRTMHCGTADAFIAMDDDHKRRWFVQSLRESKRRKELEDILEQTAQEPVAWGNPTYNYAVHHKVSPSWQGLSDDELDALNGSPMALEYSGLYKFARAIEQALKDKN